MWTNGIISLTDQSFSELMHRFEDAYDVRIVLERKDIGGYMSGKIRVSEGVEFALRLLQQSCDFTFERDRTTGTITIR